jgi:ATP-binding cassette subfamily B (MDR/TAP) protein 1
MSTGEYSSTQFFIVFISVIFSSEAAAQFFGYSTSEDMSEPQIYLANRLPGITKGQIAANYVLWLRSQLPTIRELGNSEPQDPKDDHNGDAEIHCEQLHFAYPQRPHSMVIKDVNVKVWYLNRR